jgi:apolipoprotein D and lipocalin family protein
VENSLEKERLRRFLHAAGPHLREAARSRHVQWMAQARNPQGDRANRSSKELHPGVGAAKRLEFHGFCEVPGPACNEFTGVYVKLIYILSAWAGMTMLMGACGASLPPLTTVAQVDIPRFMGDWYVIANIPTWIERGAHNAVESYRLDPDGTIATTFTFRKGGFDGPRKTYRPRGFILDPSSNAVWGMQFIWPFKSEYLILHLNNEYTHTVIGRNKRDYVWIMARTPDIPEDDYQQIVERLAAAGYDTKRIQRVPQRWPEPGMRNQDS